MATVARQISALAVTAALACALAAIFAGVGQGGTRVPHGFTARAWRALELRSDALNQRYHLGAYRNGNADSARAERALMLRGDALNRKYHLGRYRLAGLERSVSSSASPSSPSVKPSGFDWRDASIGGAATLGFLLLVGGTTTLAVRRRRTAAQFF